MMKVWLLLVCVCSAITRVDESFFRNARNRPPAVLVLLYEEWCSFSKRALAALVELEREPEFAALNIPVFAFDTYGKEAFKSVRGVKKIPILSLYTQENEIVFTGLLSALDILKFAQSKSRFLKLPVILSADDLATARALKGALFLYFGKAEGLRYQLFSEGAYEFPHVAFYSSDCPYLQEALGLTRGEFYFFGEGENPLRYKRAFQRPRYIQWIQLVLAPKTQAASQQLYQSFLAAKNPLLVLFAPQSAEGEAAVALFAQSFELYYERFIGAFCAEESEDCRQFLAHLPFDPRTYAARFGAFAFICTFSPKAIPPLFYLHKQPFAVDSLRGFITQYLRDEIVFDVFSEDVSPAEGKVAQITRDSFADFFGRAQKRDVVVMFYASRECPQCVAAWEAFTALGEELLALDDVEAALWAAHFDTSRNSHEVFALNRPLPLVRLYKQASPYGFHELSLSAEEPAALREALLRFITDAATHRLPLPAFAEEM